MLEPVLHGVADEGADREGVKPIGNPRTLPFGDPFSRQLNGPPQLITWLYLVRLRSGAYALSGCGRRSTFREGAHQALPAAAATPMEMTPTTEVTATAEVPTTAE